MSVIGYKVAEYNGKNVIVTIEIPKDAITDLERTSVIIKETAKYKTNIANQICVEDIEGNLYNDINIVNEKEIQCYLTKKVAEAKIKGSINITDGLFEMWYDNGIKRYEMMYVNGKREGLYQCWYNTGIKSVEISFKNDVYDGIYKSWYYTGKQSIECMYANGILISPLVGWGEDGTEVILAKSKSEGNPKKEAGTKLEDKQEDRQDPPTRLGDQQTSKEGEGDPKEEAGRKEERESRK